MDGNNVQQPTNAGGGWQFRPGGASAPDPQPHQNPQATQVMPQNPTFTENQPTVAPRQFSSQGVLRQDDYVPTSPPVGTSVSADSVSWTASEFIAHQKTIGWYGILALGAAVLALGTYFLTKDVVSAGFMVAVAALFGVYAARKPRTLGYRVDDSGLTIGQKMYHYDQFRSFAVLQEGAFSSIVFVPLQRFMPPLSIYYDPKDAQRIIDILADRLPMETHKLDSIERLMRRIRF